MASDTKNTGEDVDMAECDDEKIVTMMDVLQEQEEFEEDANAVLGASDDKECTYSKGYIKRQAIYACLTCCSEAKTDPLKRAGVCLACSLMCHENHELIELYTKRNFRCDCGNPKFNSHPCTFISNKTDFNEDNSYNQNFAGLYCTCHRPYPDPESTIEDLMIQCIICEDWLHALHLEAQLPANDQYSEMICKSCMEKNEFLHDYNSLAINTESADVDVVNVNGVNESNSSLSNNDTNLEETTNSTSIINRTKLDVEMTEDKVETSISSPVISTTETKEVTSSNISEIKNESANKNDENREHKEIVMEKDEKSVDPTENRMDTKQSESEQKIDSEIMPEKSENEGGFENINTETVEDITNTSAKEDNSNFNENSNPEESKKVSESTEQQVKEQNVSMIENRNGGENNTNATDIAKDATENGEYKTNTQNNAENNEKQNQDAEKMEEDKLLADPEDDKQKSMSVEESNTSDKDEELPTVETTSAKKSVVSEITNKIAGEEGPKPESDQSSEIDQSIISRDEQDEAKETPMETVGQNDIDKKPETTNIEINGDNSSEKTEDTDVINTEPNIPSDSNKVTSCPENCSEKRKLDDENMDNNETKKPKLDTSIACTRPKGVKKIHNGATFWPSHFRQKLCTCLECTSMYRDLSVLFLTDPEDTVSAYESLGKEKINGEPTTQYEKGLQALSSLDRIQQINTLTEYNKMRDKLLDFLKSFKDRKEIVKEEDIKAFFAGMKPKREPDGVYFCR